MMKKWLSLLLALALTAAPLCAPAEEAAEVPAFTKAWICGAPYGYGTTASVLVLSDGTSRRGLTT